MTTSAEQPKKVLDEIAAWVSDPFNEKFSFRKPLETLKEFAADRELDPEQRLQGSEIYYGHNVSDENVSVFDRSARDKLLEQYRQP